MFDEMLMMMIEDAVVVAEMVTLRHDDDHDELS